VRLTGIISISFKWNYFIYKIHIDYLDEDFWSDAGLYSNEKASDNSNSKWK
jgi:hypothetical protein